MQVAIEKGKTEADKAWVKSYIESYIELRSSRKDEYLYMVTLKLYKVVTGGQVLSM